MQQDRPPATRNTESPARSTLQRSIPFLWLALNAGWLVAIFLTDIPAWPLTIWIATTLGPLAALQRRTNSVGEDSEQVTTGATPTRRHTR